MTYPKTIYVESATGTREITCIDQAQEQLARSEAAKNKQQVKEFAWVIDVMTKPGGTTK